MQQPNQLLPLYDGSIKFVREGITVQGDGRLYFEWLPLRRIRFEIVNASLPASQNEVEQLFGKGSLCLLDTGTEVCIDTVVSGYSIPPDLSELKLVGYPEKAIALGSGQSLSYILCHLVNFPRFIGDFVSHHSGNGGSASRIVLFEAEGWQITIDAVEEISELIKELEASGGYAITHLVKVERSDGETFPSDDATKQLEALSWFLSFARGFHSSTILSVGFNENGNKVWEEWYSQRKSTPWKTVNSWFPEHHPRGLVTMFPNFMRYWNNPTWNAAIRLAITWYVDSNSVSSNIEGLIIWVHSALEVLSWVYFVRENRISASKFKKIDAHEKIRKLISEFGISSELHSCLSNLVQLAPQLANENDKEEQMDGPKTFSRVRNKIVHADLNAGVLTAPSQAKYEAYTLGLWYLEMLLLRLFKCQEGDYIDRLYLWEKNKVK